MTRRISLTFGHLDLVARGACCCHRQPQAAKPHHWREAHVKDNTLLPPRWAPAQIVLAHGSPAEVQGYAGDGAGGRFGHPPAPAGLYRNTADTDLFEFMTRTQVGLVPEQAPAQRTNFLFRAGCAFRVTRCPRENEETPMAQLVLQFTPAGRLVMVPSRPMFLEMVRE